MTVLSCRIALCIPVKLTENSNVDVRFPHITLEILVVHLVDRLKLLHVVLVDVDTSGHVPQFLVALM